MGTKPETIRNMFLEKNEYYWLCRDCGKVWKAGQTGVVNDANSGWWIHEKLTQHTVDSVNGKYPHE